MLTPREFAFLTPSDLGGRSNYRRACKVANLNPVPDGYGLLLATDNDTGARVTLATADVEYVRIIAEASRTADVLGGLEIPPGKFLNRPGWPDDWA